MENESRGTTPGAATATVSGPTQWSRSSDNASAITRPQLADRRTTSAPRERAVTTAKLAGVMRARTRVVESSSPPEVARARRRDALGLSIAATRSNVCRSALVSMLSEPADLCVRWTNSPTMGGRRSPNRCAQLRCSSRLVRSSRAAPDLATWMGSRGRSPFPIGAALERTQDSGPTGLAPTHRGHLPSRLVGQLKRRQAGRPRSASSPTRGCWHVLKPRLDSTRLTSTRGRHAGTLH